MPTLAQIQGISVRPQYPAAKESTRQLRLASDDKSKLDQMIAVEQQRGWVLVQRSFNLDDGHGALLYLNDLIKAA